MTYCSITWILSKWTIPVAKQEKSSIAESGQKMTRFCHESSDWIHSAKNSRRSSPWCDAVGATRNQSWEIIRISLDSIENPDSISNDCGLTSSNSCPNPAIQLRRKRHLDAQEVTIQCSTFSEQSHSP